MRLFAALPLSAGATERLLRLRLRLSTPGDGLRWSTPEQWHITLQFYGDIDETAASCLMQACQQVTDTPAPELTIRTLGRFGAKGILFAKVEPTPELQSLHDLLAEASAGCGFVPERRPFQPHITLARSKGPTGMNALQRMCTPDLPAFGPEIRWSPQELLFVRSTLRPQGAEYSTYSRIGLSSRATHVQEVS